MSKKDAEASIQNLTSQIETLKEDYNAVLIEKQAIQEKLDKAYEDSNKLYMQTVQSTGGIKILNNSDKN
jgi:outer membrane murein-binding lipoprotein Lpp